MRRPARRGAAAALVAVLALASAACSGRAEDDVPASAPDGPAAVYLAVGADATLGIGTEQPLVEEWPKVLFRTALPRDTVFVNAAQEGATVAEAFREQVALASEVEPTLVTVWLSRDDLAAGTPVADYEAVLGDLVHVLERGGKARVLVANAPEVTGVPATTVAAYNDAIARVAQAEEADLVDLHTLGLGDVLDAETQARVAEAFAAVL
jgi:lysophospholipase L1-like esterase